MPDKYSYKQSKKKKSVRRPAASTVQPVAAAPVAPATRTTAAPLAPVSSTAAAASTRAESRVGARVSNLGAELRRVTLLGGAIIVVLVAAALVLK